MKKAKETAVLFYMAAGVACKLTTFVYNSDSKQHIIITNDMTDRNQLRENYSARARLLAAEIKTLKRRGRAYVAGQLATFAAAVLLVAAYTVWGGAGWIWAAAAMFAAYMAIRVGDAKNQSRMERKDCLRQVCCREVAWMGGDYTPFADGAQYADPRHAYTYDMDVFGPLSLFQRINRTVTTGGSSYLAGCLAGTALQRSIPVIEARGKAIRQVAGMGEARLRFMAEGIRGQVDTGRIRQAIAGARSAGIPRFALSAAALAVGVVAMAGLAAAVLLSVFTPLGAGVPLVWASVQFVVVFMVCSAPLRAIAKWAGGMHKQMDACVELFRLAGATELKTVADPHLSGSFAAGEALRAFGELKQILDGLDRRGNILGLFFTDTFLLSDFFLVRRYLKWQDRYIDSVDRWIDDLSVADALVSMATYCHNEPRAACAEVVESDGVVFSARGLWHPFLGGKAVANDITLANHHYYIVTGANMAGKSTFLRAIGVNYILAMCGMPVFAAGLRLSAFHLFSSMRTSDDLGHGISYFNAELLRLRQLIDACRAATPTLIILDEILKGTNSLDKLNGSRMFLDAISALDVTGVIATHDLELSKMEQNPSGRFHNLCFEIGIADSITYTYKITPGVARNQNATHLLRNIIAGIGS